MNPSASDNGQTFGKTPTLTLNTSSVTGAPPPQQDANEPTEHVTHAVTIGNLSIHEARTRSIGIISRTASSASLRALTSPQSFANITPLPSPAGSISGSPTSRKPPHFPHPFAHAASPQIVPTRLSPGLSPTRIPSLTRVPSNTSLRNHKRSRSRSEYTNQGIVKPWQRMVVSGTQTPPVALPATTLQREEFLADKRGITTEQDHGQLSESSASQSTNDTAMTERSLDDVPTIEVYEAQSVRSGKTHTWRSIRQLGTGTFSKVMLATRDPLHGPINEEKLSRSGLVAVKICEHGPAGGADEQKIEVSLKRELEILKSINHPSLIALKAVNALEYRTYLVLNYCPGGDLFEVASNRGHVLTSNFVQRVFAELVAAVNYLHEKLIVHRDIKLENVLVNVPPGELDQIENYQTYPHSLITLTDLGLGRTISRDSPMLTTRCGSEDYAAPELLMGQEYDGRAVDAWALGVLLYAMVESRLPFDSIPGVRNKSPKTHRIARCDWSWFKRADEDLEWDAEKGKGFEGARDCVEHLLTKARNRWKIDQLKDQGWVKAGIDVEGGLSPHTTL